MFRRKWIFGALCAEVVALAVDESEQWLFSASADKAMVDRSTWHWFTLHKTHLSFKVATFPGSWHLSVHNIVDDRSSNVATCNLQAIKVFDLKYQRIQCEVHIMERPYLIRFVGDRADAHLQWWSGSPGQTSVELCCAV